ncbi:zinc-binding alcohol dehydrogenase family protein [Sulfitobacter sp. F26204]|uniref:quinone oxidoreductase family protein n=1 Tax=Sulfitobacter sp. F26204 TaxID=2996014 RepID=UPI00225E431B|nr:zinc-binding alcohol dehydrogenase family protein [Sulfitobacter sp. F26204]MCX7560994.1 zinc-binding alcohol dehydrogenase family protein [Sulfitobacter sp. F26204]
MNLESSSSTPTEMLATRARLATKVAEIASLSPEIVTEAITTDDENDAIVQVRAAAVNPSDVKAATGLMPYAVFPRTPGRDFAGTVIAGPADLIGKDVFGSSGDLGIRRDGTHGTHVIVPRGGLVPKPSAMSFAEAASIGVPFVTATEGFRRAGMPTAKDVVVVMGVNGKVGQAATQIATWRGARVIGVVRRDEGYEGHASAEVEIINAAVEDVGERVGALTNGRGADIVFNTVGDPYFAAAHKSLGKLGRQILIAAINHVVDFNIFEFYRGRHSYYGIDTLALSSAETGDVLKELLPGFESGALKPFTVADGAQYSLQNISEAYAAVMTSSRERVFIIPESDK